LGKSHFNCKAFIYSTLNNEQTGEL